MHFEKEGHSYQKYGAKSDRRGGHSYASEHYSGSPNSSQSHAHGHSSQSHYSHSSSDRGHTSRSSYSQRGYSKEKDREYKVRDSRDKYPDNPSYSKEKHSKERDRERDHRTSETEKKNRNNGGGGSTSARSSRYDEEAASSSSHAPGNEWSVHISSSGKRYYYNNVTEVSQWEKPRDWYQQPSSTYPSRYHEKKPEARPRKEVDRSNKRIEWSGNRDERKRTKPTEEEISQQNKEQRLEQEKASSSQAGSSKMASHSTLTEKTGPPIVVLDNSDQPTGSLLAAALPKITQPPIITSGVNDRATPHRDAGPPTPTHSEHPDPHATVTHLETALPRKMESIGSYSSVVGNLSSQATPMLTPSLANYVRLDLTTHVTGWPSDLLEKEAKRYADEAYQDCLQCTRESAQLKCNRSMVRHLEIQATLQEQKLMYIRQQISDLEEMKTPKMLHTQDWPPVSRLMIKILY